MDRHIFPKHRITSMQLAVFAEDFYPAINGGALLQWRICQIAAQDGHDVTVFTAKTSETRCLSQVDGVKIHRPMRAKPASAEGYEPHAVLYRLAFSLYTFFYAYRWSIRNDVDGIYVSSLSLHWVAKVLSRFQDVPVVNFVGGTPSARSEFQWTPKFFLERLNFRFWLGDFVYCQASRVANVIRTAGNNVETTPGIVNAEAIRVADESSDRAVFRHEWGFDSDDIVLSFVGRLVPLKNPDTALDIVAALPDRYKLVVVGDGPMFDQLENTVEQRGLSDRIRFTGVLEHDLALETVAATDAVLLTSDFESHPTVVYEGLTLGKHVFATPVGTIPETDYPRLHAGTVDELPEIIRETEWKPLETYDEVALEKYSIESSTRAILETMESLRTKQQSSEVA
ncbi:glycosyltransferase [Haloarcula sp. CBA1131]|nr:glycosyltransferase [Haloarcula sp. CBA1131]